MPSQAPDVKAALLTACQSLYSAPVQVCYGHPGIDIEDDIVSVANARSTQDLATMGTTRRREETIAVDVIFSCFRGGGPEIQQTVTERAYELLGLLEDYLQGSGYSLSGAVRLARITSHELSESEDPEILAQGRVSEIAAVVTAVVRI